MSASTRAVGMVLLALWLVSPTQARGQGTITGRVVQGESLRPLAGAQVSIPGSGLGALANSDGRYLIFGVPVGQAKLRVQSIGFATQERTVTVVAGQTLAADFEMATQALGLDEIVVTGTAGGQQRRVIGNVVGSVNTEATLERTAPPSMQQMLGGQVAGVRVQIGGGNVGSGGAITIRGLSSIDLDSGPLVYIDGVRVNSRQQGQASRLNDINPEDIERLEVIKGPAAATLYGTEASNGVIQIITKKGRAGAAVVEGFVRGGANWFANPGGRLNTNYGLAPDGKTIISQNLYADETAAGRPMFRTGRIADYSLSVRGGQDKLTYFLSGNREDDQGYLLNNDLTRNTLRTNLQLGVSENFDVAADLGVVRGATTFEREVTEGLISEIQKGQPTSKDTPLRGFKSVPPEAARAVETTDQVNRATASVTMSHRPMEWLSQRLVFGFDWTDVKRAQFFPRLPEGSFPFYAARSTGSKSVTNDRDLNQTADYNATVSFDVTPVFSSATSMGVQYFARESASAVASGTQLPTPAVSTVSAAAVRTGSETFEANKTFGIFVQQTVGWRGQAFVTAALRADANSAFGESFKAAYYPKFSATWVVSDAAFWNLDRINRLRLRVAWGKSGQQPATFAAIRTYAPTTGPGDVPALTPGNVGNPDLKPEVGTELEAGLDASFLGDRLSLEFTHYRELTTDAILSEFIAPSVGFAGTRYINAGKVSNRGYELKLDGRPIVSRAVELDLNGTVGYNTNKLEDLGGRPPLPADTRDRFKHVEGYPLGGLWSKYIATAEWGPNKTLINVTCKGAAADNFKPMPCTEAPFHFVGAPGPDWTGSITHSLTFRNSLTLSGYWVFLLDSRRFNTSKWYQDTSQRNSMKAQEFLLGTLDPILAAEIQTANIEHPFMQRDDFFRLRDVSLTYRFPGDLAEHLGLSQASFTVSGRNMWMWQHPQFTDMDAEPRRARELYGWDQDMPPLPNSVVTTLRVTF